MKSIFARFDSYEAAEAAVNALVDEGLAEESMNVIIHEQLAKRCLDVDLHEVDVMKSDAVGQETARGMARLLGGEQPVPLPGVGDVLAAGTMATNAAQTAATLETLSERLTRDERRGLAEEYDELFVGVPYGPGSPSA